MTSQITKQDQIILGFQFFSVYHKNFSGLKYKLLKVYVNILKLSKQIQNAFFRRGLRDKKLIYIKIITVLLVFS